MDQIIYKNYVAILESELFPALGCTEPIAVAYAAAKTREVLGEMPDEIDITCSGNIIKNVKGVVVPTSGGLIGIDVATILGVVGGQADKKLEVLCGINDEHRKLTRELVASGMCRVHLCEGEENLYISCTAKKGCDTATVEIKTYHTNITKIEKNGQVIFTKDDKSVEKISGDKTLLNMKDIYTFSNEAVLADVEEIIDRQIKMNSEISEEGLKNSWGVNVGSELLKQYGDDVKFRAAAYAAAGSDARMSGCAMPVVINSGSGNQGITVSMPVIIYAQELKVSHEKLVRALVLSNLISLNQKRHIGSLSAYCGATSAGAAAACGIAYLNDESFEVICNTIINSIGTIGGMVCDGAKPSCAAKIRSAVDTGLMGYFLAKDGFVFGSGEGIVEGDIEQTIINVGRMGRVGMAGTDIEILNIMIGK
ncbi:MAG: L-serine ammonia-lyase, iron-sulfur-dependent, subunit alpha [Oscillospiraceae bacterium]